MNESHESNKNQIDRKQEHSEIFRDSHGVLLKESRRFCTIKSVLDAKYLPLAPARVNLPVS